MRSNLSKAPFEPRRFDEAVETARRAVALDPGNSTSWSQLGGALDFMGEYEEAIVALRHAIALDPGSAEARGNLGMLLLRRGEFAEGWEEYEWRREAMSFAKAQPLQRRWSGDSLAGQRIYVQSEQGNGDVIQFARYLPLLTARGASVSFRVDQPLVKLMHQSLPGIEVLGEDETTPPYDCDCSLMSLPLLFKTRLETIPAPTEYLRADPAQVEHWRQRLGGRHFKVGIAWAGDARHNNDLRRSIDLADFDVLSSLPNLTFVSLQLGPQAADAAMHGSVVSIAEQLADFADTAAAIAALDLVVTVDCAVAHLAGALGKPTWVMLPSVADWRWMLEREDSPWYPTMRLIRQRDGETWREVIARVAADVAAAAAGDTASLTPFRTEGERRAAIAADLIALQARQQAQAGPSLSDLLAIAQQHLVAGRLTNCTTMCERILRRHPDHPEALHLLGLVAHQSGQLGTAIEYLRRATTTAPQVARYRANLGEMYRLAGRIEDAIAEGKRSIALDPAYVEAYSNVGVALFDRGAYAEATDFYQQAIAVKSDFASAYSGLGQALVELGRFDEAVAAGRRAVVLDPSISTNWVNLGVALGFMGEYEEATVVLRRAIALDPGIAAAARWTLGLHLLRRGDFAEGWEENEWRLRVPEFGKSQPPLQQPWRGDSLVGRRIYVQSEQGIGDAIQMARYMPLLLAAQAAGVSFRVHQPLVKLLRQNLPGIEVLGDGEVTTPYHCDCSLLSLPLLFKTGLETIPAPTAYLRAEAAQVAQWRQRISGPHFKVGIAWAGNAGHNNDLRRSIDLAEFGALLSVPDLTVVSLQVGPRAEEAAAYPSLVSVTEHLADFADTAAAIEALDLVVTVDSAVAHLAGALGKPTWVLIPWVSDWRWLLEREDSPWYPTMRLIRQGKGETWREVIARAAAEVSAAAAGDAASLTPFRSEGERRAAAAADLIELQARQQTRQAPGPELGSSLSDLGLIAQQHFAAGRLPDCATTCERILQTHPDHAEALHLLGLVAHQSGQLETAIEYLRRATIAAPQVARYRANLGEISRLAGRIEEAIAEGKRAIALDPSNADAYSNIGIALFDRGSYAEAADFYRRAIALRPDFAAAHSNLGNAFHALGRYHDAVASHRRAIELQPNFASAQNNLGVALRALERHEEAVQACRNSLALRPDDPQTLVNLAFALSDLDEFDEAEALLRRVIEITGPSQTLYAHLAQVLTAQQKTDEAAKAAAMAERLDPGNRVN